MEYSQGGLVSVALKLMNLNSEQSKITIIVSIDPNILLYTRY